MPPGTASAPGRSPWVAVSRSEDRPDGAWAASDKLSDLPKSRPRPHGPRHRPAGTL